MQRLLFRCPDHMEILGGVIRTHDTSHNVGAEPQTFSASGARAKLQTDTEQVIRDLTSSNRDSVWVRELGFSTDECLSIRPLGVLLRASSLATSAVNPEQLVG